jgi:hypothetical protein
MSDNSYVPAPGKQPTGRLTDALAKWEAGAGPAPTSLEEIRIDLNERLLIPFCLEVGEAVTHFLDYPSFRGYVRCNGPGCLLCKIGRKPETRDLMPVYDVISRAVGVLAVSPNMRPHALRPQLTPILRRLKDNERVLIAVRKLDRLRYTVTTLPLPEDADDGADPIAQFQAQVEDGAIDLAVVYPQLANEELAAIHEIATVIKIRGIVP